MDINQLWQIQSSLNFRERQYNDVKNTEKNLNLRMQSRQQFGVGPALRVQNVPIFPADGGFPRDYDATIARHEFTIERANVAADGGNFDGARKAIRGYSLPIQAKTLILQKIQACIKSYSSFFTGVVDRNRIISLVNDFMEFVNVYNQYATKIPQDFKFKIIFNNKIVSFESIIQKILSRLSFWSKHGELDNNKLSDDLIMDSVDFITDKFTTIKTMINEMLRGAAVSSYLDNNKPQDEPFELVSKNVNAEVDEALKREKEEGVDIGLETLEKKNKQLIERNYGTTKDKIPDEFEYDEEGLSYYDNGDIGEGSFMLSDSHILEPKEDNNTVSIMDNADKAYTFTDQDKDKDTAYMMACFRGVFKKYFETKNFEASKKLLLNSNFIRKLKSSEAQLQIYVKQLTNNLTYLSEVVTGNVALDEIIKSFADIKETIIRSNSLASYPAYVDNSISIIVKALKNKLPNSFIAKLLPPFFINTTFLKRFITNIAIQKGIISAIDKTDEPFREALKFFLERLHYGPENYNNEIIKETDTGISELLQLKDEKTQLNRQINSKSTEMGKLVLQKERIIKEINKRKANIDRKKLSKEQVEGALEEIQKLVNEVSDISAQIVTLTGDFKQSAERYNTISNRIDEINTRIYDYPVPTEQVKDPDTILREKGIPSIDELDKSYRSLSDVLDTSRSSLTKRKERSVIKKRINKLLTDYRQKTSLLKAKKELLNTNEERKERIRPRYEMYKALSARIITDEAREKYKDEDADRYIMLFKNYDKENDETKDNFESFEKYKAQVRELIADAAAVNNLKYSTSTTIEKLEKEIKKITTDIGNIEKKLKEEQLVLSLYDPDNSTRQGKEVKEIIDEMNAPKDEEGFEEHKE